ncbi:MAG TPA: beta-phosphoglucomutase [Ktedonobacteraceae bacterium]|nr:beta-phosphoglucomutase [Ktedonobacteraceae bacterium]
MKKPQAIIFDLDGVLADTSEYHFLSWKRLADEEGIPFTREENDEHLRGVGRRDSLLYLTRGRTYSEEQLQEMMDRKNRYYIEYIQHMSPGEVVPGGRQLLAEIRNAGIKTAIATSSKNAQIVIEHLAIEDLFDAVADGNSVVHGKPAPDLFIYAAGLIHTPTRECLGVEDADAGIEAIKNAGMEALAIGPTERFHDADKVLPDLAHKHLQDLLAE